MTSTLLPCRTTTLCRQGQRGLALLPCTAKQTRLDVRLWAFKFGGGANSAAASRQQQTAIVAIDPVMTSTSPAATRGGPPLPAIALAVIGAAGLIVMVFKKLKNKGLDDNTARYSVNMYLANVMKDVNTVRIEDLSSDQIEAARARRSKERANHKLSLEEIDLPQNHPFATKQVLSKEEVEQSLQNLRARSMRRRNYEAMQSEAARGGPGGMGRQR